VGLGSVALGLVLAELGLCSSTISEGRFLYFFLQQDMRFLMHRQCHRYPSHKIPSVLLRKLQVCEGEFALWRRGGGLCGL